MKVVAQNRRARFDYQIGETFEAGIVLEGHEVKSCRLGQVNLAGSYVSLHKGRPVLKQAKIAPYRFATLPREYEPGHDRTLLLSKTQIRSLEAALGTQGATVIPLEVRSGKFIKLLIGVARGRKKLDKRAKIREREVERRMRRGESD